MNLKFQMNQMFLRILKFQKYHLFQKYLTFL